MMSKRLYQGRAADVAQAGLDVAHYSGAARSRGAFHFGQKSGKYHGPDAHTRNHVIHPVGVNGVVQETGNGGGDKSHAAHCHGIEGHGVGQQVPSHQLGNNGLPRRHHKCKDRALHH